MPVRHYPVLRLLDPDRVAQVEIDAALEIAHRVAELAQAPLQRHAPLARKLAVVRGPRGADRAETARAVHQLAGCERERVGDVVALDDREIPGNEERRARRATWEQQNRVARARKWLAIRARNA